MKSLIINDKELFYVIERKNVKNINMRVKSDGIIYISAKRSIPEECIKNILEKNAGKFSAVIEKLQNQKKKTDNTDFINYLGKEYPVRIIERNNESVDFDKSTFTIYTSDKTDREKILFQILKWKSDKCVEIYSDLNQRVCNLFREHGYNVPLGTVTVKLMKSRWGSCNYVTGKISMNLRLIDYPVECIYAVFCHEYMHFIHQNHSKDFHKDLERICPSYKAYDKLLK